MADLIPFSEISHLFRDFEHTAWRLETRRGYEADQVTDRYAAFLRGEGYQPSGRNQWLDLMRQQTGTGRRVERVRVVDEPPTDNQRFLLAGAEYNIAAGEDIRYLTRSQAQQHGIPDGDYWMFDSRTVARFHFDGLATEGVELIEDPAAVLACCQIRDAAWHHALPWKEFTQVDSPA